ncbi:MAG TPA: glycosyltransferase family 39 protein [Chthoniobacterales bacterium]
MSLQEENGTRPSMVWPIIVAAFMALCIFSWLAFAGARGRLSQDSEFYTAERSREMLLLGPWGVHDNFQLSGVKPPLQYWLSAFTLARFHNPGFALRIWTLLYSLLATVTLGWLAAIIDRRRPWLIALSVGLLLTCPHFLRMAYSAMLDAGLIFFTTLLIAAAHLARSRPGWWAVATVACGVGALQKTPLILIVWILIILLRLRNAEERQTLQTKWLLWTFAAAVIAVAAWPLIQMIAFHLSLAEVLRYREPLIIAQRRAGAPYLDAPYRLSTFWPCGGLALAGAAFLPFIKRNKPRPGATELCLLCLALVVLCVLSNTRQVTYLGPILPSLCLILAMSLYWLLDQKGRIYRALGLITIGLALAGLPIIQIWVERRISAHWRNSVRRDIPDHEAIAQALAARQAAGKRLVVIEADNNMLPEEFYLFYGGINSHLANLTLVELRQTPAEPMVGISTAHDFALVQKQFPNPRVNLARHDLVCWEVD